MSLKATVSTGARTACVLLSRFLFTDIKILPFFLLNHRFKNFVGPCGREGIFVSGKIWKSGALYAASRRVYDCKYCGEFALTFQPFESSVSFDPMVNLTGKMELKLNMIVLID